MEERTSEQFGVGILDEGTERSSDERSETERSGGPSSRITGSEGGRVTPSAALDPEVAAQPRRRTYPAEYKLKILTQANACKEPRQLGAPLRREGLYQSNLVTWRRQREEGTLKALSPKKRGRKAQPANPLASRVTELERENRKLKKRLKKAETIIEIQKKTSELLGIPLKPHDSGESD